MFVWKVFYFIYSLEVCFWLILVDNWSGDVRLLILNVLENFGFKFGLVEFVCFFLLGLCGID